MNTLKIFVRHGILGSMEDLRKNDIFEAEIVGYSSDGSGVCRINGRAVFVTQLLKRTLVSVFASGNQELVALAITAVSIVTTHYLISFVNIIGSSFHTAVERPVESAVIALCRSLLFVSLPLFLLPHFIGDVGIWLAMPIAELLTLFISLSLYFKTLRRLRQKLDS